MDAMGLTANQFSRVASNLEDENANLHAQVSDLKLSINEWRAITEARGQTIDRLGFENEKLRELVRDMWRDGMCECDELDGGCSLCEYGFPSRMRELGIEVNG